MITVHSPHRHHQADKVLARSRTLDQQLHQYPLHDPVLNQPLKGLPNQSHLTKKRRVAVPISRLRVLQPNVTTPEKRKMRHQAQSTLQVEAPTVQGIKDKKPPDTSKTITGTHCYSDDDTGQMVTNTS